MGSDCWWHILLVSYSMGIYQSWYVIYNFEPLFGPFMPRTIGKIKFIQKFKKFLQGGWSSTYVPSVVITGCINVSLVTQIFGILDHSGPFSEPFAPIARKKVNIKTQKRNKRIYVNTLHTIICDYWMFCWVHILGDV